MRGCGPGRLPAARLRPANRSWCKRSDLAPLATAAPLALDALGGIIPIVRFALNEDQPPAA
jgi:hypothetical protein